MASKSKKRRKVLGASCILAALIIAGSSFAWFTSKDEVTNRLTATSDYGVSIVESFTPPKQWIPGQKINKDVYDVNTGNIAAFVNDDISGILTYTYEITVSTFDATNGVVLEDTALTEIDGATTMEAGSVLAWTNTDEPLGTKISARDDEDPAVANRWTPTNNGDYIFRRTIKDDNGTTKFTYAGYHYENGKYYKIAIGGDENPSGTSPDYVYDVTTTTLGGTGVTVDKDGIVTSGTPSVKYIIETKVENKNMTYTYDDTGADKKLVFTYKAPVAGASGTDYDASAAAARAEIDYLNAKKASDSADKWAAQAEADLTYAQALVDAYNALIAQAATTDAASSGSTTAVGAETVARTAVNTKATAMTTGADNVAYVAIITNGLTLKPATIVPTNVKAAAADATNYPKTAANYTELETLYKKMYGDAQDGEGGYAKQIKDALDNIKTATDSTDDVDTATTVATNVQNLKTALENYNKALADYKKKYADLVDRTADEEHLNVETSNTATVKDDIQAVLTSAETMDVGGLKSFSDAYTEKEALADTARSTNATEAANWTAAIAAYNKAVNNSDATTNAPDPAGATYVYNNDTGNTASHQADLSNAYSANSTGGNPVIADNTSASTYASATAKSVDDTLNVSYTIDGTATTKTVAQWRQNKTDKNSAAATALDAYNDAKLKTGDGSEIKINVILANDWDTNWTRDTRQDGTEIASFYLNKILGAGETTPKLVDSVELDSSITKGAYKNLTFDLNVALDSAQITYADDQVTVTDDAVQAPAFGMNSTVQTDNTTVVWTTT